MKRFLPQFVYGSMDGLVTTFAIVMGAVGAGLSAGVVLVVGCANVLADGFSMCTSSYLSSVSDVNSNARDARVKAGITFVSFVLLGCIPLLPFLVDMFIEIEAVKISIILTGLSFAFVGYLSGRVLNKNALWTAIRNVVIGGTAALIAYEVGSVLSVLFGV